MKKLVLTGGGSAGHVTPHLALIPKLEKMGWDLNYIGSVDGIEKSLIQDGTNVPYHGISSGKLRRYFDLKNIKDPFKVAAGVAQAYFKLGKIKPDAVFSKGGFVAVPVVIAAWMRKIPVYIHESDITPGLANKISSKFASKIFVTFDEAKKHFAAGQAIVTGSPIRDELLQGSREKGLSFLGFRSHLPVLTIMGGSLGARKINEALREALPELLRSYQIVHICGKGNMDESLDNTEGYRQFEYIQSELPDVVAATDFVISRAGSNSIFEWLTLKIPMLLIPLSRAASRGDQILNAQSFEKQGYCHVLYEEELTKVTLISSLKDLKADQEQIKKSMETFKASDSVDLILRTITGQK
ncbi:MULTISPECIES: undecaprenyldiphospho-muramoylpentapeptide beta-N-acetylglucosaminyltransferase [Fictibacillus]|uniref:undecaprenyldiphospho-muramoylpentapeptide beta-N-acetylglucosaminyltransferase n=1 Tax=Fictibacillus TaxID=1329200 RepID=UPI0018CF0950|nr:undecaprenyldiphospho-muramoylpentapeptide beta-N-acetylglucosaminyltransferase [Fictibacillus sp. 23RED33]MBH0172106.1 undecaprenyldiphospho-muramoylpentapeptide beta-N-acetylglucosaminyltransferase [Fictibacillus sp. 23RED33]